MFVASSALPPTAARAGTHRSDPRLPRRVDPAAIGLGFEVLVQVTMDRENAATVADFERGLAQIPEVGHAERLFGDPDYLLRVATADYQTLRDNQLATLPGVGRLTSTIVMKGVVDERPYPLAPSSPRAAADPGQSP